ncbi:MAG: hypothetical protein LBC09_02555, partial [Helicobacteraceae bacterium]|nr:hypothetical protein [Helicobacteraceae bacterium]
LLLSGCDESSRRSDERTGASIGIINRVTINGAARSQIAISLGDNQSGYVSASVDGYRLFTNDYLTKTQIDNFNKHLVCDATFRSGGNASFRCGWTQYDPYTGTWIGALGGDWSGASPSRPISLSDRVEIEVLISDRREARFWLYFDGEGYLY